MKFGILKETNTVTDRRVALSPDQLAYVQQKYSEAQFEIESDSERIFSDEEYQNKGVLVTKTCSSCDVLIGITPIAATDFKANTSYLFFLESLKNPLKYQAHQQAVASRNSYLYDSANWEATNPGIDFDEIVGIVGAYNAFRAFGIKFELFKLPPVATFLDVSSIITYLKRPVLPPLKIAIIANEPMTLGIKTVMKALKIKEVGKTDFLTKNYAQAVFNCVVEEDLIHLDSYTKLTDILITNAQLNDTPVVLSSSCLQVTDCKLKVVVDLAPEPSNQLACTVRQSNNEAPFYGYLPIENKEVDLFHPAAIVVVATPYGAVELPQMASEQYGKFLIDVVFPAFFSSDSQEILTKARL